MLHFCLRNKKFLPFSLPALKLFAFIWLALPSLFFSLCLCPLKLEAELSEPPLKVVCTVGMISDAVKNIGAEAVSVQTLISAGGDPHLYLASPRDVLSLLQADLVFYNGLLLEGKITEALETQRAKGKAFPVAESLLGDSSLQLLSPYSIPPDLNPHGSRNTSQYDPHVWMDVGLWVRILPLIERELSVRRPLLAAEFKQRAEQYREKLLKLHERVKELIQSIPKSKRVLISSHDAFSYFGRTYDIEVRAVQGISTESEAGLKDINSLVDFIVERKIPAVFVETSVSERNMLALIQGAAARGQSVKIGGSLFSDSLGAADTPQGTYLGMIEHNAQTIAAALAGESSSGK